MQDPTGNPKIKKCQIDFVLVMVREDSKMQANIGTACSLAERHGMEFDLFGSLITLTAGEPGEETSPNCRTARLVSELSRCLGGGAKIVTFGRTERVALQHHIAAFYRGTTSG